jgi:hypothetical protein
VVWNIVQGIKVADHKVGTDTQSAEAGIATVCGDDQILLLGLKGKTFIQGHCTHDITDTFFLTHEANFPSVRNFNIVYHGSGKNSNIPAKQAGNIDFPWRWP